MKKIKIKRKKIPLKIRMSVIVLLGVLTLGSLVSAVAVSSDEQPATIQKNIQLCEYAQQGRFNYIVHLKNNTVYGAAVLYPGQATIFKKITDYITASFGYGFDIDCSATIQGTYKLIFQLQTDIWSKEYVIIPKTNFDTDNFSIIFEINTSYYENIIKTINDETGVQAQKPMLNITCEITINAQTEEGNIYETFTPELSILLNGNTIEINNDLVQTKIGSLQTTIQTPASNEKQGNNNSLVTAAIFFIPIIPIAVFTRNDYTSPSETEKQLKKIMKKYGEWIVEVDKPPKRPFNTEIVQCKTIEDLMKISEEIGKPVLHSASEDNTHTFYVLEETMHYQYVLSGNISNSDAQNAKQQ